MATLPTAHDAKIVRRNMVAGAINSFFVEAAMTSSEPGTVLTLFVKELTGSTFLAGLLPSLRYFGWLAPQLFAASLFQRMRRFLPAVQVLEIVRCSLYLLMAVAVALWSRSRPELVLILFATLFMITRVAAGSSAVARNEIVARMVPQALRSNALSLRRVTGGVAGLLAGFLISYILDERTSTFPVNYAVLLLFSGIAFGLAILSLSFIIEPDVPPRPQSRSIGEQVKQAPTLLRGDRRYALYIGIRLASAGMTLASPFFVLFAREALGAPVSLVGLFISARTLFRILSNAYWGRRSRDDGSATVLSAGAGLGMLAPAAVIAFAAGAALLGQDSPPAWMAWLFGLVFMLQGLAGSAEGLGQVAYLYDIAPEGERPTYYGLANTLMGPLYFLPALGGALVAWIGYVPIFAFAALMMAAAYALSLRLVAEGQHAERRVAQAISGEGT